MHSLPARHLLAIIAFMLVSFTAQGLSHFVINVEHFAAISFTRPEPVIPMGLAAMVIQGGVMSAALVAWKGPHASLRSGLQVSLAFGLFLISYIALVEPSKYTVPSIADWMAIEGAVGLVQFTTFGALLGLIHRPRRQPQRQTPPLRP